jgi:hypothetical protein
MSAITSFAGHYYNTLFHLYGTWEFWAMQIPFFVLTVLCTVKFCEGVRDLVDSYHSSELIAYYKARARFRYKVLLSVNLLYLLFGVLYVFNHM